MDATDSILGAAFGLIASGNADLFEIIALSLQVTITAVLISCIIGLP